MAADDPSSASGLPFPIGYKNGLCVQAITPPLLCPAVIVILEVRELLRTMSRELQFPATSVFCVAWARQVSSIRFEFKPIAIVACRTKEKNRELQHHDVGL